MELRIGHLICLSVSTRTMAQALPINGDALEAIASKTPSESSREP